MLLAEVDGSSHVQYSDKDVDESLDHSSDRASQLKALIESEIHACISEGAKRNQYAYLSEGELVSTYVCGFHKLSRLTLKHYTLEQLIVVSCDSSYGEAFLNLENTS